MCLPCEISSIVQLSMHPHHRRRGDQAVTEIIQDSNALNIIGVLSLFDVSLWRQIRNALDPSTPFLTLPGNVLQDQTLIRSQRLRKRKNGERKKCNAFLSGAGMHFTKQIHFLGVASFL